MAKKKMVKKKLARLPEMRAFVACDGISRDPNTGKASIYGIFDRVWAREFPFLFKVFFLYARLKGGDGRHSIEMHVVDPDGRSLEKQQSSVVEINLKPTEAADVTVQAGPIQFKKPGVYQFFLRSGRRRIGKPCEITVTKTGAKK